MKKRHFINYLLVLVTSVQVFLVIQAFSETNLLYQQLFSGLILFLLLVIIGLLTKQNEIKIESDEKN